MPQQSNYDTEEKLGDCNGISGGRVDDRDAKLGRGVERDVVDADAGAANNFETRCRSQHLFRNFGRASSNERIVCRESRQQLSRRKSWNFVDVEFLDARKKRDALGVDLVRY